jgi:hypothetical protein
MVYILDWATTNTPEELVGKTQIAMQPNTTDTRQLSSLVLFGKGAPNYGEGQQENFLRLLENFAAPTAPVNPTIGQLWFKTSTNQLMVCVEIDGGTDDWMPIGVWIGETAPANPFIGQLWFKDSTNNLWVYGDAGVWIQLDNNPLVRIAYNYEYNRLIELYNSIVVANNAGTSCADSYGWNQGAHALSPKYLPSDPVTNPIWVALLDEWKKIAPIVSVDPNKFESDGFIIEDQYNIEVTPTPTSEGKGIATIMMEYERCVNAANEVYANRFNFAPSYMEAQGFSTINDSAFWTGDNYLNLELEWSSVAAMNNFFLTGGYIKLTPTFNQQIVDLTTEMWKSLIAKIGGGIFIKACGTYDQGNNAEFSRYKSYFELPDSVISWPTSATPDTVGITIYKAYEEYTKTQAGYQLDVDGTDTDLGWADITVEARRKTAQNKLQVRIKFQNETGYIVRGILGCDITSYKATSGTWGSFTPVVAPVHPALDTAVSFFI